MESLRYLGSMAGHKGWITAIATSSENPDMILTASRGMSTFVTDFHDLADVWISLVHPSDEFVL